MSDRTFCIVVALIGVAGAIVTTLTGVPAL